MRFSDTKTKTALTGAILGAFVFILIYGIRVIDPTYDDWLMTGYQDLVQHYLGWVSYRHSEWRFPIGLIEDIVYPHYISVIYTDSVPLFAVPFKLLSPVLPETFQYFGIFGLCCFALMGYFSTLILCHLTGKKVYSIIGSLFFDLSYVMIDRMFFHTALAAQWLILATIAWWYIGVRKAGMIKNAAIFTLLSVASLLTEAYFLPMVWGIMLCALLEDLLCAKKPARVIIPILISGAVTILTGYAIGVFYGDVSAANGGLGIFSFNLNGFINSQGKSAIFPQLPLNLGQFEGFSYLGCGMFALIVICLVIAMLSVISRDARKEKMRLSSVLPHILYVVCFTLFALSPIIALGERTWTIDIPEFLYDKWSVFRSSGRMIWPVYYLIMVWVISYIGKNCKKSLAMILLVVGLLLQIYDESGFLRERQEKYYPKITYTCSLGNEAWDSFSEEYEHIMVYPNTFSIYSNYKGEELWAYALKNNMTMNIVYLARDVSARANEEAYEHFAELMSGESYPDTMYVFFDEMPPEDAGLDYYEIDGITVGLPAER